MVFSFCSHGKKSANVLFRSKQRSGALVREASPGCAVYAAHLIRIHENSPLLRKAMAVLHGMVGGLFGLHNFIPMPASISPCRWLARFFVFFRAQWGAESLGR
jgi:hypothetical protein